MSQIRVAVTGMGVITPIASTIQGFSTGIFEGKTCTGPLELFDTTPYSAKNGGEVKDFTPEQFFTKLDPQQYDRTTQFAVAAAKMAVDHASLQTDTYDHQRIGVIMGTTFGNQQTIERNNDLQITTRSNDHTPNYCHLPCHTMTAAIACEHGFKGPNMVIPTACAAGNYAISYASEMIRLGKTDCMVCGGSDAFSRACYTMFGRLGAISPDLCKPFDADRHGMLVAEGAAALVIENYDHARARGATIYAEIAGFGHSCDAHHATSPHPDGYGAIISMKKALESSKLSCTDIDYISAHGTGTKANDISEAKALQKVFGDKIKNIPLSSIKSLMGHTMGAASAVEAVASVLAVHQERLPVNANLTKQQEGMDLNIVTIPERKKIEFVLSNAFAFGGNICAIIIKKPEIEQKESVV